jgi:hypothetical protein
MLLKYNMREIKRVVTRRSHSLQGAYVILIDVRILVTA